jgi:hypothetical protein
MSERKLTSQQGNVAVDGHSDLSSLAASKDLHKQTARSSVEAQAANQSDLTSASISSKNIVRATPRTEIRKDLSALASSTETSLDSRQSKGRTKHTSEPREPGVFKNAHWEYRGGPISRFITLIANILKVIERLILKFLGGGDAKPLPHQTQNPKLSKEPSADQTQEQERKAREREARSMHTHRS